MALDLEGSNAGGGGAPARYAKLQPLNYTADLFCAYAFNEPGALCNVDRSGNGRDFSIAKGDQLASDMANVPDLVPGKGAIICGGPDLFSSAPNTCRQHDAAWQLEGALTITYRYWNATPAGIQTHVPFSIYPTFPASIPIIHYIGADGFAHYYCEADKVGQNFNSSFVVPENRWSFMSLRRDSTGRVTLGLGLGPSPSQQVYQSSAPGALLPPHQNQGPPSGWAARFLRYDVDNPAAPGGGAMADFVCWTRYLSDAELVPQYGTAMVGADLGF